MAVKGRERRSEEAYVRRRVTSEARRLDARRAHTEVRVRVRLGYDAGPRSGSRSLARSRSRVALTFTIYHRRGTVIKHTNSFALERKLVCNSILALPPLPPPAPLLLPYFLLSRYLRKHLANSVGCWRRIRQRVLRHVAD